MNFAGSQQTLNGGYAQTYTGTGTFGTGALRLASFAVQNAPGVTIDPGVSALNVYRVNAFYGAINNADKIAIGAGDATIQVVQRGATGIPFAAGSFDVSPTYNIGSAGLTPGLFAVADRDDDRPRDPEQPYRAQHPDHQPDRRHAGGRRSDVDRRHDRAGAQRRHAQHELEQSADPDQHPRYRGFGRARQPARSTAR